MKLKRINESLWTNEYLKRLEVIKQTRAAAKDYCIDIRAVAFNAKLQSHTHVNVTKLHR